MELHNEFTVGTSVAEAWTLLTDLGRIAPCLPGATLEREEGGEFFGRVKVKVGPMSANFAGSARFVETDDASYRAVILATGTDPRGQTSAEARISAHIEADGSDARVVVVTSLALGGRLATFGRGALADVSARLMDQFAANVNGMLSNGGALGGGSPVDAGSNAAEPAAGSDLDLVKLLGPMARERAASMVTLVVTAVIAFLLGRSSGHHQSR